MRIVTWNVNSIRSRLEHLEKWITLRKNPEIICLQETKVQNNDFPKDAIESLGYKVVFNGQKSYNGVCILAKSQISDVKIGIGVPKIDQETRVISGVIEGLQIVNVYIPNGQMPNSDKYVWKFEFLKAFTEFINTNFDHKKPLLICGDINIAHTNLDVWDPELYKGHIMFTEAEKNWLTNFLNIGFTDVFRKLKGDKKDFSWYDYRSAGFQTGKGWRIDYFLVNDQLLEMIEDCVIDQEPRGWDTPSDHCPVVIKLK